MGHSISTIRLIQRFRSISRTLCALLLCWCTAPAFGAETDLLQLFVAAPYLELHTGPGRGYPVFHTVPRHGAIDVLKRRTDWFKVRTERGVTGWAHQTAMAAMQQADGSNFVFDLGDRSGFSKHRYEMGLFTGDYGGASLISTYGSYSFNSQLAAELAVGQFLGNAANGTVVDLGLTHVFIPDWRFSPFAMLGTGYINIEPKATLVAPLDREDQTAYYGLGMRFYLTRRFFLRGEYKNHLVFTSRNSNDKVDEWKLGFAFFF